MKLHKSWLLLATCTIILVVTTYATSTEAAKQKQAEVNLQQQVDIAAPSRSLKYGDKTTRKLPNQEVSLLPTSPTTVTEKKRNSSNLRPRSRVERIELPTQNPPVKISRRYDSETQQNLLVVQHDVPLVEKTLELFNNPITSATKTTSIPVGQQRQPNTTNRSRSSNALAQTHQRQSQQHSQQPTQQYSHLNYQNEENIAKIKNLPATTTASSLSATRHNSRQRKPTTIHNINSYNSTTNYSISSNNNANVHTHYPTNNSTIVSHHNNHHHSNRHHHNNENMILNNNINSKSQSLLATSNVVASAVPQPKISSNKQRGNVIKQQNVSSTSIRSNIRKFTTTAPTISAISSRTFHSSSSSSTTTTTTTTRPLPFQLPNNFNIFTPEFWQFLNPTTSPAPKPTTTTSTTTTSTRRPPKKYKPPPQINNKEEKLTLVKPKPSRTTPTTTTTTTKQLEFRNNDNFNTTPKRDDGPFRIALPTFNVLSSKRETNDDVDKGKRNVDKETNNLRERFDCPRESEVRFQLFPKICKIDEDCKVWNREEICCEIFGAKSCVSGIPKPLEETSHAPILGVIPRKCPNRPLAELWWEVKECETDMDCWPRVCCPDGRRRYCRTSQPELDTVPVPVQRSFNYLTEYLECTAPPPPIFDLHPKVCTSTLDCFPNVCCQEAGLRHCRPPKKSVLTMLANVFNVDFVKRLTQNIVIK